MLLQAGGAARVGEENRIAASQSPCQAENASDVMTRFGNYLGSWIGLSPVPEEGGESAHSDLHLTSAALQNQICGDCDALYLGHVPKDATWAADLDKRMLCWHFLLASIQCIQ